MEQTALSKLEVGLVPNNQEIRVLAGSLLSEWLLASRTTRQQLPFDTDHKSPSLEDCYDACRSILGFWEAVGFFARRKSIDLNECLDLYGAAIEFSIVALVPYISRRNLEDIQAYEGVLWLYNMYLDRKKV